MNPQQQINGWLNNPSSKKRYEKVMRFKCFTDFINRHSVNFYYIDDSLGDIILEWKHNDYIYYLDCQRKFYFFCVYNYKKQNLANGYSRNIEDIVMDLDNLMLNAYEIEKNSEVSEIK